MAQAKTSQSEFDAKIAVATEIDFARLAAYIDGEGTIMIGRTKQKKGTKMPQFLLTVLVANTDLRLIAWLSATFCGLNYHAANSNGSSGWGKKPCYSWRVFEKRAATILERVIPYLICKREQAEVALAYRALREQGSKGVKLTLTDIEKRNELRNKVRALNGSKISDVDQEIKQWLT